LSAATIVEPLRSRSAFQGVLVSRTVKDLVSGSGITFADGRSTF
jgi:hypothetical protein